MGLDHPLLGPGERHPRLPRRGDLQPRAPAPPGRRRGELPSPGGGLRRPARGRVPSHLGLLGRQPAEDRAGARARPEPGPPPRRPAHARRGHRRDRVHPPAPRRAPRRAGRRSSSSRSSWTRSWRSPTASWSCTTGASSGRCRRPTATERAIGLMMAGVPGRRAGAANRRPGPGADRPPAEGRRNDRPGLVHPGCAARPRLGERGARARGQSRPGARALRSGRAPGRREPAPGAPDPRRRRLRQRRGHRLHALLRDQLRLHGPGGGRRLPRRALQHRRRGPGVHRRARRGAALPRRGRLADGPGHPGRHRRGRGRSAPPGRSCRRGSRPGAAATSSSRRSCSTSSPRR